MGALLAAWLGGAPWWSVLLVAAAWGAAAIAPTGWRLPTFLAAGIGLAIAIPAHGLATTLLAAIVSLALAATALLLTIAPGHPPSPRAYAIVAITAGVTAAFALVRESSVLIASELAPGALTLALAAGLLVATPLRAR